MKNEHGKTFLAYGGPFWYNSYITSLECKGKFKVIRICQLTSN